MSNSFIYPDPTPMASGVSSPYSPITANIWNGQYQANLQAHVDEHADISDNGVEPLADNTTQSPFSTEQLQQSGLGLPSEWSSGNHPALLAMEREVRRHQDPNHYSSYTPPRDLGLPQWLHNNVRAGRLPYLQLRMRDLEFAGFIARLGESMPAMDFSYMIAQSEDRHAQQGHVAGVILNRAPLESVVRSQTISSLALKRKGDGEEVQVEQGRPSKRKAVQKSSIDSTLATWDSRISSGLASTPENQSTRIGSKSPQHATPQLGLQAAASTGMVFGPTPRRAVHLPQAPLVPVVNATALIASETLQRLPANIPQPPPLPNLRPRQIMRFTRRTLASAAHPPINISANERYDTWAGRPKKRGTVAYAPPPGLLRILADVMLEGLLPEGTFTDLRNPLKSRATPAEVDIRLCGALQITAEEILAFFPNHLLHREIACRLFDAGWTADMIVKWIYRNRRLTDRTCAQRTTVQHQLGAGRDWRPANHVTRFSMGQASIEGGYYRKGTEPQLIDYYLVDLANGVGQSRFPTLEGRGALTRAIEHALTHAHIWVKLSEVQMYVHDYHLNENLPEVNVFEDEASWMKTQRVNKIYYARNVSDQSY